MECEIVKTYQLNDTNSNSQCGNKANDSSCDLIHYNPSCEVVIMNQGVIRKESEGMSGKHEKVGSNKSLEDVNNDHDIPESRIFPFTIAHLESDEVKLMGRKAEILLLRESLLEALNTNDRGVADRDELRQANTVLKRKLSESMSENVKLQAVVNNLKNELQDLDILDPMITVQKLKSESKKLETSINNRRTKIMNDHRELMERLEVDHKARKTELEQELRELVLLVDGEKDKLRHLQDQVSNLESKSSFNGTPIQLTGNDETEPIIDKDDLNSNDDLIPSESGQLSHLPSDANEDQITGELMETPSNSKSESSTPVVNPFKRRFQ